MQWWRAGLALVVTASVLAVAPAAHADRGYQFWNYFRLDEQTHTWAVDTASPPSLAVVDGQVYGWRFATTTGSARAPRTTTTFDQICGDVPSESGKVRVAVVIDAGTDLQRPLTGTCVVTNARSSVQQALGTVAWLRFADGQLCAINGYPATGCGNEVKADIPQSDAAVALTLTPPIGSTRWTPGPSPSPTVTANPAPTNTPTPAPPAPATNYWLQLAGQAILIVIAGGAIIATWRGRRVGRGPGAND